MAMNMNDTPRLQWQHAGTLYHPDGGDWSKTKHEAEATWRTPHGPGRYRIWHESSIRGGGYCYSVVRLKPSTGTLNGHPRKFSGYLLEDAAFTMAQAMAIAEADNVRLSGARP